MVLCVLEGAEAMGQSSFDVNDGKPIGNMPRIAVTEEFQRQLLAHNPTRLYWPEEFNHGS